MNDGIFCIIWLTIICNSFLAYVIELISSLLGVKMHIQIQYWDMLIVYALLMVALILRP